MNYFKTIIIILGVVLLASCTKEEFIPKEYSSTSYVDEYVIVSVVDTIAKADSLQIILYDISNVETCRISFNVNSNRLPGSDIHGIASYVSFGFDTLVVDNNASLEFIEGDVGSNDLQKFRLNLDFGEGISNAISLSSATISLADKNEFFNSTQGLTNINQLYHYQFGPIVSFKIIGYN